MDNLTHTLTGLMVARAGFSRVPRATLICLLAANAPDLDVITALAGSHVYLDHHRGFTHGLLAAPALALLCAAVGKLFAKQPSAQPFPWLLAILAALTTVLSHLALDWTNIYGIRLLAPFSQQWFRGDIASVFDPLLFTILLAFTFWPLLGRLVSQEIGAHTRYGVGSARTALVLATLYLATRGMLHERALATLDARLYEGKEALRTAAFPTIANPFRWRGLVDLPDTYRILPVNLLAEYDPDAGRVLYKGAERNTAAQAAAQTEPFQALTRFAPYLFWQVGADVVPEESFTVEATDLRFALPGEGRFTAKARLNAYRKILSSEFRFSPPGEFPQPR
jgi:inner membrane protein